MSDLGTANCGCGCEGRDRFGGDCGCGGCNGGYGCGNNGCGFGNNSCLWIILLLFCCGGGNGCGGNHGGCNDSCLWIILLTESVKDRIVPECAEAHDTVRQVYIT